MKQKRKNTSLNTLANQIFAEHLEWQRYAERFGTIVISKNAFRLIMESLSEAKVVDLAINIACGMSLVIVFACGMSLDKIPLAVSYL